MTAASTTMAASRCAGQSNNLFVSGQLCPDFLFFCRNFLSIAGQRPYNSVANVILQMLLAVAMLIGQYSECMSLTPRLCRATKSPYPCREGACPRRVTRQRLLPCKMADKPPEGCPGVLGVLGLNKSLMTVHAGDAAFHELVFLRHEAPPFPSGNRKYPDTPYSSATVPHGCRRPPRWLHSRLRCR